MLAKKFIGKPYAGKPHVRFDEGVGKVILSSRSTLLAKKDFSEWTQYLKIQRKNKKI
jgi:hypothetical protein